MDGLPEEMFNKHVEGGNCPDQLQEAKASAIQLRQVCFSVFWPEWPHDSCCRAFVATAVQTAMQRRVHVLSDCSAAAVTRPHTTPTALLAYSVGAV
jgi:hypothetical protein